MSKDDGMKKWVSIFLLGMVCALSVACGVKGPLYFPENETVQNTIIAGKKWIIFNINKHN